ncbi:hypothetical protein BDW59DRAFT_157808 [Aspergillus cavernicola]|uniref:Uncharacterized protein n=1 Tax=Aspergillus cavernicola TaxID=176166 RepID=A0ABR4IUF6_9EURO
MAGPASHLPHMASRSQLSYNTNGSNSTETQPPAAFLCPFPTTTQHGYQPLSPQPYNPALPGSFHNDFLGSLHANAGHYTIAAEREREWGSHAGPDLNSSAKFGFPAIFQAENHNNSGQGQSYDDMTALITPDSSDGTVASSSLLPAPRGTPSSDSNINEGVATQLAEFSSAVFHSQAEIAGIASAVAEYIAWMRKVPAGISPSNTNVVFSNVLDSVEDRLREMGEMAQNKPRAAFREMVAGIRRLGPAGAPIYNSLGGLEEEFEKQSADMADFFSTRYNACAFLSGQAQNVPSGLAPRSKSCQSSGSE